MIGITQMSYTSTIVVKVYAVSASKPTALIEQPWIGQNRPYSEPETGLGKKVAQGYHTHCGRVIPGLLFACSQHILVIENRLSHIHPARPLFLPFHKLLQALAFLHLALGQGILFAFVGVFSGTELQPYWGAFQF